MCAFINKKGIEEPPIKNGGRRLDHEAAIDAASFFINKKGYSSYVLIDRSIGVDLIYWDGKTDEMCFITVFAHPGRMDYLRRLRVSRRDQLTRQKCRLAARAWCRANKWDFTRTRFDDVHIYGGSEGRPVIDHIMRIG